MTLTVDEALHKVSIAFQEAIEKVRKESNPFSFKVFPITMGYGVYRVNSVGEIECNSFGNKKGLVAWFGSMILGTSEAKQEADCLCLKMNAKSS